MQFKICPIHHGSSEPSTILQFSLDGPNKNINSNLILFIQFRQLLYESNINLKHFNMKAKNNHNNQATKKVGMKIDASLLDWDATLLISYFSLHSCSYLWVIEKRLCRFKSLWNVCNNNLIVMIQKNCFRCYFASFYYIFFKSFVETNVANIFAFEQFCSWVYERKFNGCKFSSVYWFWSDKVGLL